MIVQILVALCIIGMFRKWLLARGYFAAPPGGAPSGKPGLYHRNYVSSAASDAPRAVRVNLV